MSRVLKNLNLFTIRLPITALVSILHRLSGLALFVFMPFLTIAFVNSLLSNVLFDEIFIKLTKLPYNLIFYLMIWGMIHHLIAGLRHILLDMQIGNDLIVARFSSKTVLILSLIFTSVSIYIL
tara:strand:- start:5424 stop:5792 length:369 start_codon:yes stop_codon:yes gene_type:complete